MIVVNSVLLCMALNAVIVGSFVLGIHFGIKIMDSFVPDDLEVE